MKKRCAPTRLDEPPYDICFLCWGSRQKRCNRKAKPQVASGAAAAPARRRSHPRPPPACAPAAAAAPPSFLSGPTVDSPLFTALPTTVPLHGSVGAPLSNLIGWHDAIFAARDACRSARASHAAIEAAQRSAVIEVQVAASRIAVADNRLIKAWRNYYFLVEGVVWDGLDPAPTFPASELDGEGEAAAASASEPKGKGKAAGPPSDAGDVVEVRGESSDELESDDESEGGGQGMEVV